ncbi:hypothetical protein A2U01_0098757, partial [Trifolium medium]|nr:hypothetical protein [Trifolium medium]
AVVGSVSLAFPSTTSLFLPNLYSEFVAEVVGCNFHTVFACLAAQHPVSNPGCSLGNLLFDNLGCSDIDLVSVDYP